MEDLELFSEFLVLLLSVGVLEALIGGIRCCFGLLDVGNKGPSDPLLDLDRCSESLSVDSFSSGSGCKLGMPEVVASDWGRNDSSDMVVLDRDLLDDLDRELFLDLGFFKIEVPGTGGVGGAGGEEGPGGPGGPSCGGAPSSMGHSMSESPPSLLSGG